MTVRTLIFLGGTFNPVHVGHARLALECQLQVDADRVLFVPSRIPPHKPEPGVSSEHRLNMLTLVVDELNRACSREAFGLDACELNRAGTSYTVDTLTALRQRYPQDCLLWLIGMDSLVSLASWHQWPALTDQANLLVVNRPGFEEPREGPLAEWLNARRCSLQALGPFGNVAFIETTPLSVSSTAIRAQIRRGTSPLYLLSKPVQAYIEKHNLYS